MTSAPKALLDTRTLLLNNLDGLAGAEVGIVGDAAHRGGYHCGRDRVDLDDYSVRQSPRDRNGLCDYASALDVGQFSHRVNGKAHDLRTFSAWLVAQCKANAGDTRDIREVIYSTDGRTVKRWDRLGTSGTGDSSHLFHTHISVHRDATKAGRGLVPLMTRYLTEIGQLAGEREDDDMFEDKDRDALTSANYRTYGLWQDLDVVDFTITSGRKFHEQNVAKAARVALEQKVAAMLTALSGVDEAVAAELKGRFDAIDANLAATQAAVEAVDDQVVERLGTGDLTAQQKADLLRDVLGDDAAAVGALLAQG